MTEYSENYTYLQSGQICSQVLFDYIFFEKNLGKIYSKATYFEKTSSGFYNKAIGKWLKIFRKKITLLLQ